MLPLMSCASLSINLVPIGSVKMTRAFSLSWRMTVIISGVEERCILWEWGLFQGPESAPWSWSGLCYFQQRSRVIDFLWEVISQCFHLRSHRALHSQDSGAPIRIYAIFQTMCSAIQLTFWTSVVIIFTMKFQSTLLVGKSLLRKNGCFPCISVC